MRVHLHQTQFDGVEHPACGRGRRAVDENTFEATDPKLRCVHCDRIWFPNGQPAWHYDLAVRRSDVLLAYAKLFVENLPLSEVKSLPWLHAQEKAVETFLNDPEWYCDPWPGKPHTITFFSDAGDGQGKRATWQVDTSTDAVTKVLVKPPF